MRHLRDGRKLGRTSSHRKALLRNIITSLIEHEKIETTDAKAKELRKLADQVITWGKRGDLHARRQVLKLVSNKRCVHKLFSTLAPRFSERNGGYTRILKVRRRKGDNAPLSIIEFTSGEGVKPSSGKAKKAKKTTSQEAAAKT